MNHCKNCNVEVDSNSTKCPLCNESFLQNESISKSSFKMYPEYEDKKWNSSLRYLVKVWLILSVLVSGLNILINVLLWNGNPWSVYVVGSILYLWLLGGHTMFSKSHAGEKILFQLISLSVILYAFDKISGNTDWALNYVIPVFLVLTSVTINTIVLIKRKSWQDYSVYQLFIIVFSVIPMILFFFGVVKVMWTSVTAMGFSTITLMLMLIISKGTLKSELARRFHV